MYEWICIFSSDAFFPKIPPIHTHRTLREKSANSPYLAKIVLNASALAALVSIVDITGTFGRLVGDKKIEYIFAIYSIFTRVFFAQERRSAKTPKRGTSEGV